MTTRRLVLLIAIVFALGMGGGATLLKLLAAPRPSVVTPIELRHRADETKEKRSEGRLDRKPDKKQGRKKPRPAPAPAPAPPPPPPPPAPESDGGAAPAPPPAPAPAGDDDDDDDDGESDDGGTDD